MWVHIIKISIPKEFLGKVTNIIKRTDKNYLKDRGRKVNGKMGKGEKKRGGGGELVKERPYPSIPLPHGKNPLRNRSDPSKASQSLLEPRTNIRPRTAVSPDWPGTPKTVRFSSVVRHHLFHQIVKVGKDEGPQFFPAQKLWDLKCRHEGKVMKKCG